MLRSDYRELRNSYAKLGWVVVAKPITALALAEQNRTTRAELVNE